MKTILLFFTFLLFYVYQCKTDKHKIDIIPEQKMILILTDVMIAESAINFEQGQQKEIAAYTNYYYSVVFDKYKITKKQFEENMQFYSKNNKDFNEMFLKVIANLNSPSAKNRF